MTRKEALSLRPGDRIIPEGAAPAGQVRTLINFSITGNKLKWNEIGAGRHSGSGFKHIWDLDKIKKVSPFDFAGQSEMYARSMEVIKLTSRNKLIL